MNSELYRRLALTNIAKNRRIYLPYIVSGIFCVAMFYIIRSLALNPGIEDMIGASPLASILMFASHIIAIFVTVFLLYTNSFLMKQRKKEIGVFHVLGMEKRHLSFVMFWECLVVTAVILSAGIAGGIVMDKLMYMLLLRLMETEVPLGFFISADVVMATLRLFAGIFAAVYLFNVVQIRLARPVELLHGTQQGEREPRAKALIALLGLAALATGYGIAVTTESPLQALTLFFVAVLLVIAGTYLLFTAGSISLLKLLRNNRRFYYQTRHFVSVSGMFYRMKRNAVGLANICILSTMVLVMMSATTALLAGIEDIQHARFPESIGMYLPDEAYRDEVVETLHQLQKDASVEVIREKEVRYLQIQTVAKGDEFMTDASLAMGDVDNLTLLAFLPLDDFCAMSGEAYCLQPGEVIVYGARSRYAYDSLKVFDRDYRVAERLTSDRKQEFGRITANIMDTVYVVVPDMEEIYYLQERIREKHGENAETITCYYGFETADASKDVALCYGIQETFAQKGFPVSVECREAERVSVLALYGGLFFIGGFLGILFALATVMIIYYKQIAEGYEDRGRFAIMQQVGMSPEEVDAAIRSQVMTVFFLPLVFAGLHLAFAVPIVGKLLKTLALFNTPLYVACAVGCFLVFALFYIVVYGMTSRAYGKIVRTGN